jgi:TolB-like protein
VTPRFATLSARIFASLAVLSLTQACATTPIARRATAIADADREAKRAVAQEAKIDAGKIPARSFSVLPFTATAPDTALRPLGYALSDFLMTDLAHSPQLKLVERQRTEAILRELDLVDQGVVDPRAAPRVGRLLGARRVLIGEITAAPGDNVVLSARVVDVIAGTVEQLVSASAPMSRMIEAEKALAIRVFEELGIQLTPSQRALVEQNQTTNLAAVVAYGRGVRAEANGDASGAVAGFDEAVRLDAGFSAARTSLAAAPPANAQRSSSVQRVLDLSAQAINAPVTTKLPEAADVPLQASQVMTLLITVRVNP